MFPQLQIFYVFEKMNILEKNKDYRIYIKTFNEHL